MTCLARPGLELSKLVRLLSERIDAHRGVPVFATLVSALFPGSRPMPRRVLALRVVIVRRSGRRWRRRTRCDRALSVEAAAIALDAFAAKWDGRFPSISKSWNSRWEQVTFFAYPPEIRKIMYTTNEVESVNASIRKVTRQRGAFPTTDSVRKVLYLAIMRAQNA